MTGSLKIIRSRDMYRILKKTTIVALVIIFITAILNSAELNKRFFKGAINNKYNISMEMTVKGSQDVTGTYYYESQKRIISINGDLKNSGISLKETDMNNNITGIFNGKFVTKNRIEGKWSKPDGTKDMSFYLDEQNIPDYVDLTGYWNISSKNTYDFSLDIKQSSFVINAYHSGMTKDASRIDAVIPEDTDVPSIIGLIQGKIVKGTFTSGYSEAKGEFLITIINDKEIKWVITKVSDGEIFIPSEATLKR
jgi:hypothetical protein